MTPFGGIYMSTKDNHEFVLAPGCDCQPAGEGSPLVPQATTLIPEPNTTITVEND